jgi:hypothetical protein
MTENQSIPEVLFKYFPPERCDFFSQPMLRFTPLFEFNDPLEGQIAFNGFGSTESIKENGTRQFFEKICACYHLENIKSNEWTQIIFYTIKIKNIGVLCLSDDKNKMPTQLLQWAHYAKNHTGFAVKFDTSNIFFDRRSDKDDKFCLLRKVEYKHKRICKSFLELFSDIESNTYDPLLIKSIDWEYEKEWRLIKYGINNLHENTIIGLENIHFDAVKAIYLGLRSSIAIQECAKEFCKQFNCQLFQAKLHDTDYALKFDSVDLIKS